MKEEALLTSLIDEYSSLYERHLILLKMVQRIIPLLDEMEESKEKQKIVNILVSTGKRLIRELDISEESED